MSINLQVSCIIHTLTTYTKKSGQHFFQVLGFCTLNVIFFKILCIHHNLDFRYVHNIKYRNKNKNKNNTNFISRHNMK